MKKLLALLVLAGAVSPCLVAERCNCDDDHGKKNEQVVEVNETQNVTKTIEGKKSPLQELENPVVDSVVAE